MEVQATGWLEQAVQVLKPPGGGAIENVVGSIAIERGIEIKSGQRTGRPTGAATRCYRRNRGHLSAATSPGILS